MTVLVMVRMMIITMMMILATCKCFTIMLDTVFTFPTSHQKEPMITLMKGSPHEKNECEAALTSQF